MTEAPDPRRAYVVASEICRAEQISTAGDVHSAPALGLPSTQGLGVRATVAAGGPAPKDG